jgi:hypothetical protein
MPGSLGLGQGEPALLPQPLEQRHPVLNQKKLPDALRGPFPNLSLIGHPPSEYNPIVYLPLVDLPVDQHAGQVSALDHLAP